MAPSNLSLNASKNGASTTFFGLCVLFRLFFFAFHLKFINCFYILWDTNISTNSTVKILILSFLLHSIHLLLSTFSSVWNLICMRTLISLLLLISPKRLSGHWENFHLYLSPAGKSSWSPHKEEWENEAGFPRPMLWIHIHFYIHTHLGKKEVKSKVTIC